MIFLLFLFIECEFLVFSFFLILKLYRPILGHQGLGVNDSKSSTSGPFSSSTSSKDKILKKLKYSSSQKFQNHSSLPRNEQTKNFLQNDDDEDSKDSKILSLKNPSMHNPSLNKKRKKK